MLTLVTCLTCGKSLAGWQQISKATPFCHDKVRSWSLWSLWATYRKHHLQVPVKLLQTTCLWVVHHVFSRVTNTGTPHFIENGGRACVRAYRERRKCIGCAVLISLPSNLLLVHQGFHRLIVWESSNNYAPKADTRLLQYFFHSASCWIKPWNFVTNQIWEISLLSYMMTKSC